MTDVIEEAEKIVKQGGVLKINANAWRVKSMTERNLWYTVVRQYGSLRCECPYNFYKKKECKHIFAVKIFENLSRAGGKPK